MRRTKERLRWDPDPGSLEVVRVLVLLQAGFALLSVVEVVAIGVFTGTLAVLGPAIALNAGIAGLALLLVAGLGRRSYLARRLVMTGEAFVVVTALVDLALAIIMAGRPLGVVTILTRVILPVGVIVVLRRTRARLPAASDLRGAMPAGVGP